jgi:histidinol dehydrogenase
MLSKQTRRGKLHASRHAVPARRVGAEIDLAVSDIMKNVKRNGFAAVREYSLRFDGAEPREIGSAEMERAFAACPAGLIGALERAAANIRSYHERLLKGAGSSEWRSPDGGRVGVWYAGFPGGIYVPGGYGGLSNSSVLMNAVPAMGGRVEEVVMVTPPTGI